MYQEDKSIFNDLVSKHPKLFELAGNRENKVPIGWSHIECGPGWISIIDEICTKLDKMTKSGQVKSIRLIQVKEKFGRLRIYYDIETVPWYKPAALLNYITQLPYSIIRPWLWNFKRLWNFKYLKSKPKQLWYIFIKPTFEAFTSDPAWVKAARIVRNGEHKSGFVCEACGKPGRLTNYGWMRVVCEEHEKEYKD